MWRCRSSVRRESSHLTPPTDARSAPFELALVTSVVNLAALLSTGGAGRAEHKGNVDEPRRIGSSRGDTVTRSRLLAAPWALRAVTKVGKRTLAGTPSATVPGEDQKLPAVKRRSEPCWWLASTRGTRAPGDPITGDERVLPTGREEVPSLRHARCRKPATR